LTCRISPEEVYVFELDSMQDSLHSYAQAVEAEIRVRKLTGSIKSTFEEALLSAGGEPRLAWRLSDILSGDIDFFTEVRRGDAFSILVEERYVEGSFVDYGEILFGWYRGKQAETDFAYFCPPGGKGGHYDLDGGSLRRKFLRSPLNYRRISSHYSNRRFHPILKKYRPHHGVDYAAPTGTPVVTVADGVVTYAGWKGGYGRLVEIRHSPSHSTRYGHLSRFAENIRKGSRVEQAQRIGFVGSSGLATGPHLHFEMRVNSKPINPLAMKTMPAEPIPKEHLDTFRKLAHGLVASERSLAAGALLEPGSWRGMLLAQAGAQDTTLTAD
jgi:murein DD-endopeptidase MepM/ murein hydrolase activator NlpD